MKKNYNSDESLLQGLFKVVLFLVDSAENASNQNILHKILRICMKEIKPF